MNREERIHYYCLHEYVTVLAEKLVNAEDEIARLREDLNRMELERDSSEMRALKAENPGQDGWGETDE